MSQSSARSFGSSASPARHRHWDSDAGAWRRWQAEIGSVKILFGDGRAREAGSVVRDLGCRRALLISDPGVRSAGHVETVEAALLTAEVEVSTFSDVDENPTTEQVEQGVTFAASRRPDCIVALGGGSAMDCAKGVNFVLTNGGQIADYWGFGRAIKPMLPAIGIPTTAGTGSEAQSFALISDRVNHRKMACGDPKARFHAVVLDPALTASAPRAVAAASGLDALSHAVESFVTTVRNPVSRMLAREAWQLLESRLENSLTEGASLDTRGRVLLAAHLAGAAIEQSMLGAAHACANPLTAAFGITHGLAVALMLPHVVRYNADIVGDDYRELAELAGLEGGNGSAEALARRLEELRAIAGLPDHLQLMGVSRAELPALAESATMEWTARFNPRPVSQAELLSIYEMAY